MAESTDLAADFVTILSSELIATIVGEYFNATMFKTPVIVVDLKPTADGYAFSLAFVEKSDTVPDPIEHTLPLDSVTMNAFREYSAQSYPWKSPYDTISAKEPVKRAANGRFIKVEG
jgi:hypothetical protein